MKTNSKSDEGDRPAGHPLECVQKNQTHPGIDDRFKHLCKKLPHLSKRTVSHNLKPLSESGVIQELDMRGVKRFEPVKEAHRHFICKACDRVFEAKESDLTEHTRKL